MNKSLTTKRQLSARVDDALIQRIEEFRSAQIAQPTRVAALSALIRLGLESWQKDSAGAVA